ncbi:MAG TPA: MarR family transcriptional regulator [Sphingomonas sp.]|nr:MarR family transcriptional regulator [Sphingomonas sp.]
MRGKKQDTAKTGQEGVAETGDIARLLYQREGLDHRLVVERIIRVREARGKFMPENWFSDPAWDILLRLYQAYLDGLERTVGDLGSFASTSPATTNRWLDVLSGRGWIHRRRCDRDQRRVFISLNEAGAEQMRECLEQMRAQG